MVDARPNRMGSSERNFDLLVHHLRETSAHATISRVTANKRDRAAERALHQTGV